MRSDKRVINMGGTPLINPLDMHKLIKQKNVRVTAKNVTVDRSKDIGIAPISGDGGSALNLDWTEWLPFAAKHYHISPKVDDYILVPVFTIPTDLPNRNGVAFPLRQLVRFNPEYGMQAYKTFKAKPTHFEHRNDDITEAKGVIVDTFLRKMVKHQGIWKLLELLSFDRTKDPDLCRDILSGAVDAYSMGAWVDTYTCSYCDAEIGACTHLHPDEEVEFYQIGNALVFRNVVNPVGFETSAVGTPAFSVATGESLFGMGSDLIDARRDTSERGQRLFQFGKR